MKSFLSTCILILCVALVSVYQFSALLQSREETFPRNFLGGPRGGAPNVAHSYSKKIEAFRKNLGQTIEFISVLNDGQKEHYPI